MFSAFLCSKQAVLRMSTKYQGSGGVIVIVSCASAYLGSPNEYIDYAATKGAMDSMTHGLALEVAAEGIRVNGVRPALIDTDIHALGGASNRAHKRHLLFRFSELEYHKMLLTRCVFYCHNDRHSSQASKLM